MKKILVLLLLFDFALLACKDSDETTESTTNVSTGTNTARDSAVTDEKSSNFLTKAANSGITEIQLAKLAQQKATIDAVKNFAVMLEKDHTAVNEEVKDMAAKRNVSLPATPSDDKRIYNDLEKENGKEFDKEYISKMINSHKDGIDLYEDIRDNSSDIDIKNFADKILPKLKMHLDSAQAIKTRYW